jgi:pimeloyl-ACP methyl ester carboxylesterase
MRVQEDEMPTPRPTRLVAVILAATLLAVAWSSGLETIELDGYRATFDPSQAFTITEGDLDCTPFGGSATIRVTETLGRLGEADYLIYQPADWNGDLVLWAHGLRHAFMPDGTFYFPVPLGFGPEAEGVDIAQIRNQVVCRGFAFAASAFERNGLAVAEGTRDTHLLNAIAPRHLGATPSATYVTGHSLGGLIAVGLAEGFPHRYAGAVSTCGVLAGMDQAADHVFHMLVLFDAFFPGLLASPPGTGDSLTPQEFDALAGELAARVQADPAGLQRMANLRFPGSEHLDPDGSGIPLLTANQAASDPSESIGSLVNSLLGPVGMILLNFDDQRTRGGGMLFDNQHVTYTGPDWASEEEADLNARVTRISADPWVARYWTFHYEPSGELEIPLVSVVPSHDPIAPMVHEWSYAQNVARTGSSHLYSTWVIPRYGHFTTPQEYATALLALVDWVDTGVRPTWPAP